MSPFYILHFQTPEVLLRVIHRPRLSDDRHLDLAWILHGLLDLLGDVAG